ncbi:hypothetical protein [Silvibacterium dinghuense]|uniref:Uncharacterized protein n=1 Tax=Silvibacterium dinghuense TaxID=1560006 RepID=A0A4Q1SH14_9BACT|nr:hypothetical protein [Silvibacterium dinghuense]RXS96645.1 hypothetical protein ESZ00_01475 [Silvibacterium dinghuense]
MPTAARPQSRIPAQELRPLAHPETHGGVHLWVRNGLFHVMDNVVVTVPRLDAWIVPREGQAISLDDKKSFILQINSGETHLEAKDLSALLNDYLLPHAHTPIKDIEVSFENGQVLIKGELHKVVDIPFSGTGTVSVADDDELRIHFTEVKVAGVIRKGILDALGIKLASVAQPRKTSRFYIDGNDVILPIHALFPPPRVTGKLTSVRIEGSQLIQVFGDPRAAMPTPPTPAANFLYFRGGSMKFGKFVMSDADLQLIDRTPANSFDFSLDHYVEQVEAGYCRITPSLGLLIYMPDYASLHGSDPQKQ